MGADGGYHYIRKSRLRRGLSEEDIDLFIKFVGHSFSFYVKEDIDVVAWEQEHMSGVCGEDWFRLPEGTDFDASISRHVSDHEWASSPEEVWYYKEWMYENFWKHSGGYYWWANPKTWYRFEIGSYRYVVPSPDELESLVRIVDWIEDHHPTEYLETWT